MLPPGGPTMKQRPAISLIFVLLSARGMPHPGPPPPKLGIPRRAQAHPPAASPGAGGPALAGLHEDIRAVVLGTGDGRGWVDPCG